MPNVLLHRIKMGLNNYSRVDKYCLKCTNRHKICATCMISALIHCISITFIRNCICCFRKQIELLKNVSLLLLIEFIKSAFSTQRIHHGKKYSLVFKTYSFIQVPRVETLLPQDIWITLIQCQTHSYHWPGMIPHNAVAREEHR